MLGISLYQRHTWLKLGNLLHTAHCTLHTAHCTLHTAHCTPPASSRQRRYLHQVFYFRGFTSKLERPRSSKLIYHQKRGVDFLADTLLLIRVGRDIRKLCGGLCPLFLLSQNLTAQSEIVIVQLKKSSYLRCLSNLPLNFPCEKHCKFLDQEFWQSRLTSLSPD